MTPEGCKRSTELGIWLVPSPQHAMTRQGSRARRTGTEGPTVPAHGGPCFRFGLRTGPTEVASADDQRPGLAMQQAHSTLVHKAQIADLKGGANARLGD